MTDVSRPGLDDFVLSMPDDMLTSEALNQISGQNVDVLTCRNFVETFEIKHSIQEAARESDQDENEADSVEYHQTQRDIFYGAIINGLRDISGIMLDVRGHESLVYQLKDLYDMYVVRRHRNLVEYYLYYILHNKASLASRFNDDRITNLTVKNARKEFGNKVDATIAVHAFEIVSQLLNDDEFVHPETMLEVLYQSSPEDLHYATAKSLFDVVALNFDVPKYINHIRAIYSNSVNLSYLQSDIIERLVERFKMNAGLISQ